MMCFLGGGGMSSFENTDDEYEYCTRCDANLTLQKGYSNDLPYWVCKGCGEMLINPNVNAEDDIAWICDKCGAMLNIQKGFEDNNGEWFCAECGYKCIIDESELYDFEDEYQTQLQNPYRGLSDEDVLALSMYQEIEYIDDRVDIILVKNPDNGRLYIKKLLAVYNRSIYEYLKENPIAHMPRIVEVYESANCLIVIEEYIEGRTVAQIMDEALGGEADKIKDEEKYKVKYEAENVEIEQAEAIRITKDLCEILDNLHNLPAPIIHRDIKPSNVLVTSGGEVFLLDMNVAKWYDPDESDDTRYLGTRLYAAPEQAGFGLSASSTKTDIYAVGVLLNVMLTGAFPKEKRATGKIWDVIKRCISLDADKRYTAGELREALGGAGGGTGDGSSFQNK